MKITAFRETIAGIEVVDAEFADSLLTAISDVISVRETYHRTFWALRHAVEIFGDQSEEYLLWKAEVKNLTRKYKKSRKVLKNIIAKSQVVE